MIREIIKTPNYRYGRFFLSTEAPGDETDDSSVIKANTKVITVKPNNRNRIDFTTGAEDFPEEEETPDETNSEEMNNTTDELDLGDNVDFTSDDDTTTIDDTGETEPEVVDNDSDVDIQTDDQSSEPVVQDGDNPDDTNNATVDDTTSDDPNAPDLGDEDVDFTSDVSDDGTTADDTNIDEQPTDGDGTDGQQPKGPGLEYDSTRKYKLFQNYMTLINAIDNYIAKLESRMSDDHNINKIFHKAINQLQDIRDLAFDYVTMKFEISTYVQSLLFYENLIVMIQLVFEFIQKSYSILYSDEKSKNNNNKK